MPTTALILIERYFGRHSRTLLVRSRAKAIACEDGPEVCESSWDGVGDPLWHLDPLTNRRLIVFTLSRASRGV